MAITGLGKNLIPDQFSFQAVKERRRKKKSQREEHCGRERKSTSADKVDSSDEGDYSRKKFKMK